MTFWQGAVVLVLWVSMGLMYVQSNRGLLITLYASMDTLPVVTVLIFILIVLLWPVVVNVVAIKGLWEWFQQHRKKGPQ